MNVKVSVSLFLLKRSYICCYIFCMAVPLKVVKKINEKLKFLYRTSKFLTPELRKMLCNALTKPHFDYACKARYTSLAEKTRYKLCKRNVYGFVLD